LLDFNFTSIKNIKKMGIMKLFKNLLRVIFLTGIVFVSNAQVVQKIGANPTIIKDDAVLELESTTKGFLKPRMTSAQMNALNATATTGLEVFCTNCATGGVPCFYNGTSWDCSGSAAVITNWALTGNAATVPGTNFIGTTDAKDLVFKTGATERMRITSAGKIKIADGSQGVAKVLTSDANGVATWQSKNSSTETVYSWANDIVIPIKSTSYGFETVLGSDIVLPVDGFYLFTTNSQITFNSTPNADNHLYMCLKTAVFNSTVYPHNAFDSGTWSYFLHNLESRIYSNNVTEGFRYFKAGTYEIRLLMHSDNTTGTCAGTNFVIRGMIGM
jgi:hypothetical protein